MPRAQAPSPRSPLGTSSRSRFPSAALVLGVLVLGAGCRGCSAAAPEAPAPAPTAAAAAEGSDDTVDALTPPPAARPPDLQVDPLSMNGDPRGPRQEEFDKIHAEGQRQVQVCLDRLPSTVALPGGTARLSIRYEVHGDGKTKEVSVTGELPAETLACGKAAIEGLAFPHFEGPGIRNAFSLSYSRGQTPDLATPR